MINQDSRLLQFFGFSPYKHFCEFLFISYFITIINKKLQNKTNVHFIHFKPLKHSHHHSNYLVKFFYRTVSPYPEGATVALSEKIFSAIAKNFNLLLR